MVAIMAIWGLVWHNPVVMAATQEQALDLVRSTTNDMLQALRQRQDAIKSNPDLVYELANTIAVPHFDFEYITQYAVGKFWRNATAGERQALIREFRTLLVHTYAKTLANYSGQTIDILPMRPSSRPNQALVRTKVRTSGGAEITLNFSLYVKAGMWKVYDVTVNGVSLVTNYRGSFAQEVRKGGISGLIQSLTNRNRANR
ncbi:hypothetical protein TI04_03455 [Achromatium sp. WMS2]|nr:hypothetical protein TI04_03455 [Achromatium sp. WMS2]